MNYVALAATTTAIVYVMVYFWSLKEPVFENEISNNSLFSYKYIKYAVLLFVVFMAEMVLSAIALGHKNDIALFKMWASFGEEHKIWEYYTTEHYVDYPPVYLYVLYTMGKIASFFGVSRNEPFYLAFVKFIPILCDAISCIFIFKFAKSKIGEKKAFCLAGISLFNPAFVVNSAVWGQCDSFVALILILMLFALYDKRTVLACFYFSLAFMTKPQMIIYAPLLAFTILADLVLDIKKEGKRAFKKPVLGFLAFCAGLLIIPLLITKGRYTLLINKIIEAFGKYPYASLNSPNLYGALGLNWTETSEKLLSLPIFVWGFIFIIAISLIVGIVCFTARDRKKVFYLSAFTTASIYFFAHTMHERYLHAVLLVLMIIFVLTKDKRMIFSYFAFSISLFISQMMAMITNGEGRFILEGDSLFIPFIILSVLNLIIYAYMVFAGYKMLYKKEIKPAFLMKERADRENESIPKREKLTFSLNIPIKKSEKSVPIVKKDVLIMTLITLVYGAVAFYQLGSNDVPETGYMPTENNETVTIDLGNTQKMNRIYLHAGWIDRRQSDAKVIRDISILTSSDGRIFAEVSKKLEIKSVFRWHHLDIDENTRFVKLKFDEPNFYINEIAFFGKTEEEKIQIQNIFSENETAKFLIDEQDKVKYNYSWYDGTYFDEIYHPRTAYEHLTKRYPYENTHPPLGKVIISLGMLIFGVNPFGWRFFGCLSGVLMVPVMYIFGKKMFKSSFWASVCCALFAFDFMHLSQTRLATIDSFTALFVMCSYLFMFLYIEKSYYIAPLKKTAKPLFLSGLFFGLATAVKWQGLYAGLGLCVIFAIYLSSHLAEFLQAKRENIKTDETDNIIKNYKGLTLKTIGMAVVFFVIVPFFIYFLSYIPAMNTNETGLSFFFTNQGHMLNYHSNLSPDSVHPYSSMWWSWPLDLRPLYAYGPDRSLIADGYTQKIASFGNPAIWWLTIPVILLLIIKAFKKGFDNDLKIILVGFFAMYLPWAFISREAFIYHFFPCVIFVVLGIVYVLKDLFDKKKINKSVVLGYVGVVVLLFAVFYPILTGMVITKEYSAALRWLDSWPF